MIILKSKSIFSSFKYAITGIFSAFKSERNLKVHTGVMILVIIMGFIFRVSLLEWGLLIFAITLVIGSELFNTALEETVNLATKDISEHAKLAKDISAGAVLIFAVCACIVGAIIFIPKIMALFI